MIKLDTNFIGMVTSSTRQEHVADQQAALDEAAPSRLWAKEKKEKRKARGKDSGGAKETKRSVRAFVAKRVREKWWEMVKGSANINYDL